MSRSTDTARLVLSMLPDDPDLEKRFSHHPPRSQDQADSHEIIRAQARTAAATLKQLTPACREQALAMTALEEFMMWANAAIARHPEHFPPDR